MSYAKHPQDSRLSINGATARGSAAYPAFIYVAVGFCRAATRLHILYRQGGRLSMDGLETNDNAIARAKRDSQQAARLHSALVHMRTLLQVILHIWNGTGV